ncbi:type II 3-dehydroquinate dehydratase (plasmid) [Rhodococcoides fascians]|uniref:type II 3-dehydroquinate dehydratase n=1 Tax=Rhodococcoides fascians TaxID=1828 RepID=UPI003899853C
MADTLAWHRGGTEKHTIVLIDGPNMPNLGKRNKRVYGPISSIDSLHEYVKKIGAGLGVEVETFTSNYEGAILDFVHESSDRASGYLLNPAGLTTTGEPTRHALEETKKPFVEIHFSNISAPPWSGRGLPGGPWQSNFTRTATGMSMGLREHSYLGAIIALVSALDDENFLGQNSPL